MEFYDVKEVGSGPIIGAICRQLKTRETANQVLPWDTKQCLSDRVTHLVALVKNILSTRARFIAWKIFTGNRTQRFSLAPGLKLIASTLMPWAKL